VVLWTITAFVRSYVGPPKIPTFHQLASTASINAPATDNPAANSNQDTADRMMADAAKQAKLADPSSSTVEAKTTAMSARNDAPAPKGPFLGDRPAESAASAPVAAPTPIALQPSPPPSPAKMADVSSATPLQFKPAEMPAPAPVATVTPDTTTSSVTLAAQEPADPPQAAAMPAAAPLSGPVPLPRRRPHVAADAQTAAEAPMTQMASASPGAVPMPRPRPDAAGPGSPAEPASSGPLDFIQNLFSGK
jgi:hypothetical protein